MAASAMVGSALVGGAASIYGSQKASKAQQGSAQQAIAALQAMYNQTRSDLAPYRQAGEQGINPLLALAGVGGDPAAVQAQLEQLPGYQFALTQGLKAQQNSATARGLGVSGAALKGGANFATGLADQTFGNQFNRILGLTQLGQNAAAQTGQFGANASSGIANALIGSGNAQAAGWNALGTGVQNAGQGISSAMLLQQLLGQQGGMPKVPQTPQPQSPGLYGNQGGNSYYMDLLNAFGR
jgi:hypothetical protein